MVRAGVTPEAVRVRLVTRVSSILGALIWRLLEVADPLELVCRLLTFSNPGPLPSKTIGMTIPLPLKGMAFSLNWIAILKLAPAGTLVAGSVLKLNEKFVWTDPESIHVLLP